MHLCLLEVLSYITLLVKTTLKNVEVQNEYLDYFTRDMQFFGSSLICVVSYNGATGKRALKLSRQ